MRTALVLGGTLTLLAALQPALAQTPPLPQAPSGSAAKMKVLQDTVVYSGPGDKLYPTGQLKAGEEIEAVHLTDDGQWLAIAPPQGSFSYIDQRSFGASPLKTEDPRTKIVSIAAGEVATLYVGSAQLTKAPDVAAAKVTRGTFVVLLEGQKPLTTATGTLVPVLPTPGEVRYIKASAVGPVSGVQVASHVAGPGVAAPAFPPAAGQVQHTQTALQGSQPRPGSVPTTPQVPGHPNGQNATGGYPAAQLVSRPGANGQNTTLYNNAAPASPATGTDPKWKWSSYGVLQRTSFQKDGQTIYRLVDNQGKPLLYASPQPGKSLDPYVGKMITLYGPVSYQSNEFIRSNFMTAYYASKATP